MPEETKIVSKEGVSHIVTSAFTAGGVGAGVWINQNFALNKGTMASVGGAIGTVVGAALSTRDHGVVKAIGAVILGASLSNLFLGLYDLSQGNY